MTTSVKTCFKCGAEKPLSMYYAHPKMADGHLNKCKKCTKADVRARRFGPNREAVLAYDRARGNRQSPEYGAEYRKRFPKKRKAANAVNNAVRDGKLTRQDECQECGSTRAVHGHHDDYAKPLEVRWLCAACHRQWHAENGEAKNAV